MKGSKTFFNVILSPYYGFSSNTWKLLAAGFVNSMGLIIIVYISLYLNSLHFNLTQIGIILTLFGLSGVVGGYCGGLLSEHYTPLASCKISLLINTFLIFLLPLFLNYYFFAAISVFIGFFLNIFRPAFIIALSDKETEHLERVIALRRVAINFGMAIGASICGLLANINFRYVFYFNAIASLFAFLIIIKMNDAKAQHKEEKDSTKNNEKKCKLTFYFLLLLTFMILLVFNQSQAVYPLFLKNNLLFNTKIISVLFMINGIIIALFQVPVTNILRNFKPNTVCAVGGLLVCMGFSILPWATSKYLIILSCVLWTFGEIIFFPTSLAMLLKLAGNRKAKSMGVYQMVFSLATFLAPAIGTAVYSANKNLLWYLSGVLGIIVTLVFIYSTKYTQKTIYQSSALTK